MQDNESVEVVQETYGYLRWLTRVVSQNVLVVIWFNGDEILKIPLPKHKNIPFQWYVSMT